MENFMKKIEKDFKLLDDRIKSKLDIIYFNMNKTGDDKPSFRNAKIIESEKVLSGSFHYNFVLDANCDFDYCPFIVSKYELSIKLNSPNNSYHGKTKANFESKHFNELISIQSDKSIGKGISKIQSQSLQS